MLTSSVVDDASLYRKIRWSAMGLLARREHSRFELVSKLHKYYPASESCIDDVLRVLADERLQCDKRYAQAYVSMRQRNGYGPRRIAAELKAKGVSAELIDSELMQCDCDWFAIAHGALTKKFRKQAASPQEKAKRIRFMQYRGFSFDHIHAALRGEQP